MVDGAHDGHDAPANDTRVGSRPKRTPTIFVTDAAAESARIADTLRMAGYSVVDVPLSMLVSRAEVQRPNVVLLDVDAASALDEVTKLRRLPGGGAIDFVYFGSGGGVVRNADDAMSNEGSAFFPRPVEIAALVRRVESLTGGPVLRAELRPSTPPPSIPRERHGSAPPPDRSSSPSLPAPGARTPGPPLPMSTPSLADLVDPPRSLATFGTVSNELQQLLAEAELRAEIMPQPDGPMPTPEEEIEAVLPADVLASLDESIESDEDEEHDLRATTGAGAERDGTGAHARATTSGGSKQTTASGRAMTPSTHERRSGSENPPKDALARAGSDLPPRGREVETSRSEPPVARAPEPKPEAQKSQVLVSSRPSLSGQPRSADRQSDGPRAAEITSESTSSDASTSAPRSDVPRSDRLTNGRSEQEPSLDGPTVSMNDLPSPSQTPTRGPSEAPPRTPSGGVVILGSADARRFLADAIARRSSGALCFEHERVVRRLVVRDGDLVTAASGAERESLVAFLGGRGDLPRDEVERLAGKIPPYGRHAGAALVAHGWLGQDQLWTVLRAHAEWIATSILRLEGGTAQLEAEPPGRLRSEPSVFGASTGAEIFVDLVRRAVSPEEAIDALGGEGSRISDGPAQALLAECALAPAELELVSRGRGGTLGELLARAADAEIAAVIHALALLGVLDVMAAPDVVRLPNRGDFAASAALDDEALRARIRARLELVDEGDYFSILGVSRDATNYEVRRAFLELRRAFEPARILSPRLADLAEDVRKIVIVLEEAYEILRDVGRRERYRRAIEARLT